MAFFTFSGGWKSLKVAGYDIFLCEAGLPMNILIGGEAGQGLVTVGEILAKSLVRSAILSWSPRAINPGSGRA